MRRWTVAAFAILAVNLTVEAQTPATFIQDVQPILVKHCQSCHRRGEVAPMPLTTYAETKPRAGKIKDLVSGKKMPPELLRILGERFLHFLGLRMTHFMRGATS